MYRCTDREGLTGQESSLTSLVDFTRLLYNSFPHGYVEVMEDDYGFAGSHGQDLTGLRLCSSESEDAGECYDCYEKSVLLCW